MAFIEMEELLMSLESGITRLNAAREKLADSKARERLTKLFDEGTFTELDAFNDSAEVIIGYGIIEGAPAYAFAQDINVYGGAVGMAQAAKIKKVYDLCVKTGLPVIGIYDSKGAYLNEGCDALAAYGELMLWSNNISGVVPQISVIAGPCAGSSALLAASGDIVIHAKEAIFSLDAQNKEAEKGISHITVDTADEAIAKAREIITLLPINNLSDVPISDYAGIGDIDFSDAEKIIKSIADADSFIEIQSDYGKQAVCGLARINGQSAAMIATCGGILDDQATAKAARLIRLADAFSIPVITFVDAEGFDSIRQAAKLTHAYAEATCAKLAVITGKAVGSAYIAMAGRAANADYVCAWPDAYVSALPAEAAVAVLWEDKLNALNNPLDDRQKVVDEYKATDASVFGVAAKGYIEDIIEPENTRAKLITALDMLASKRISRLAKKHSNIQL